MRYTRRATAMRATKELVALKTVGRYQQYANGGRTWRLDTATGQTCLLLAPDADWKKPEVSAAIAIVESMCQFPRPAPPVSSVEASFRFYVRRLGFTENHSMAPRLARRCRSNRRSSLISQLKS
jgi:hypothetical protein